MKQVGRDLGVRYVLEGSVRKAGNRVRVTGQLIDVASGAHIWADRFDRDLTDIFAVQDELTQEIISALKVKLTPENRKTGWPGRAQSTRRPTTSSCAGASRRGLIPGAATLKHAICLDVRSRSIRILLRRMRLSASPM